MIEPTISELLVRERDILTRIAAGGPLEEILRDLVLMVEQPSHGEMLASVLFLSPDRKHLLEGAAPSLPAKTNRAASAALFARSWRRIDQRLATCSTRGVRNTSSSALLCVLLVFLNRLPSTGTSPSQGSLLMSLRLRNS